MLKYVLLTAAALYAAGVPMAHSADPFVTIKEAKRVIAADNRRLWKDPDSVRDAGIGQPYRCPLGGTCVCVEVNARNGFGGRGGLTKHVIRISGGRAEPVGEAGPYAPCGSFAPFPEINGR